MASNVEEFIKSWTYSGVPTKDLFTGPAMARAWVKAAVVPAQKDRVTVWVATTDLKVAAGERDRYAVDVPQDKVKEFVKALLDDPCVSSVAFGYAAGK